VIINDRASVWADCEKRGEAEVRAQVDAGTYGMVSTLPREWLHEKAEERRIKRETEQQEVAQRAVAAAEASARAAEAAANAARKSERWTMYLVIAALLSIVVQYVFR